jgi:hypothetical protein
VAVVRHFIFHVRVCLKLKIFLNSEMGLKFTNYVSVRIRFFDSLIISSGSKMLYSIKMFFDFDQRDAMAVINKKEIRMTGLIGFLTGIYQYIGILFEISLRIQNRESSNWQCPLMMQFHVIFLSACLICTIYSSFTDDNNLCLVTLTYYLHFFLIHHIQLWYIQSIQFHS